MSWGFGGKLFLLVWVLATLAGAALFGAIGALFACCGQAYLPAPDVVRAAIWEGAGSGAIIGGLPGLPVALLVALAGAWLRRAHR